MAISYPISTPDEIGIANIALRTRNAITVSKSPFTYASQTIAFDGEEWGATVTIPPLRKEYSEPWVAFLVSLRGRFGTFLLGDPNLAEPQGTATSATLTGALGDRSPTITMTGTLLRGDYIQLGSGADAKLHKVLVDRTGTGTLEIWPALRASYTTALVTLSNPRGVFRLTSNVSEWDINNRNAYGLTFDCEEAL